MEHAGPSDALLEFYTCAAASINEARAAFLDTLNLSQPSVEEEHFLKWSAEAEEAEVVRLTAEVERVSAELDARAAELSEREGAMEAIKREQRDDRMKIQRLVALCQPVMPDITFIVDEEWVRATATRPLQPAADKSAADSVPEAICTQGYAEYLRRRAALAMQHVSQLEECGSTFLEALKGEEPERISEIEARKRTAAALGDSLERRLAWVKAALERVTGEYLTLRHNVRVVHEYNAEAMRACDARKQRALEGLATLEAATGARRREDCEQIERRLAERLRPLQRQLEAARAAAAAARAAHARRQRRYRDSLESKREKLEELKRRHERLNHKRAAELAEITAHLTALRKSVSRAEAAARLNGIQFALAIGAMQAAPLAG